MEFPKSRVLSTQQLIQHIIESNPNGERFCFILGSGASVESGIPSGNTLEMQWMNCIMGESDDMGTPAKNAESVRQYANNLYNDKLIEHKFEEIENAWRLAKQESKSISSTYYFDIFKLRFFPSRRNGYRYLERIMDGREPSLGYLTLAKLLTETNKNNLVITTNFDSLVEDALFLYTNKRPLVVSHESLAGYIESDIQRPIIAKVHRGLMYEPFNTPETTDKLQSEWRDALSYAFNTYTPIVLGYAGGDRSLMAFLKERSTVMRNGVFWCYREASGLPDESIQDFVLQKKGYFVSIDGFDSLMMKLGSVLYKDEIKPINTESYLKKQCEERIKHYNDQWYSLDIDSELQKTLQSMNKTKQCEENDQVLTVWDFVRSGNLAYEERRYSDAIKEYEAAIQKDPNCATAYNNQALAYRRKKMYEESVIASSKAIELDPNYAMAYSNRGFAYSGLEKYTEAIEDYSRAIEINPNFASAYNNRGYAYKAIDKINKAIEDYTKAIELEPNFVVPYNNRGHAYNTKEEYQKAMDDCNKAIELKGDCANPYRHRGDAYCGLDEYEKAIEDYSKAIALNPEYRDAYLGRAKAYRKINQDVLAEADEKKAEELLSSTS